MRLKIYPMSNLTKLMALGLTGLTLTACDLTTSREAVQARVGQSLDEVIADWGFPTGERKVAGRNLVYWEDLDISYEDVPSVGVTLPIGRNGGITAEVPLGDPDELRCIRTLELDRSSKVKLATLEGNNCPHYAPRNWL